MRFAADSDTKPRSYLLCTASAIAPEKALRICSVKSLWNNKLIYLRIYGMTKASLFICRQCGNEKKQNKSEPARFTPESDVHSRRLKTLKCVVMEKGNWDFLASSRDQLSNRSISQTLSHLPMDAREPYADSQALNCYHVLSIETLTRFMAHFWCLLLYDKFKEIFLYSPGMGLQALWSGTTAFIDGRFAKRVLYPLSLRLMDSIMSSVIRAFRWRHF